MNTDTFYTRRMLLRYSRQLVAARRLARYDRLVGREETVDNAVRKARRRTLIERVAREIMESLIFSGVENSVVREVRGRLSAELGEELVFRYPPDDPDFKIFRPGTGGGETELAPGEKQAVMGRLWDVTLKTVDATML
ncbi:MAG: hypothetical protein LBU06_10875 [Desulfovibrio sp.]|jgi:hypothetical protein|nr:hypothetical protein [Desulfovibrio sp.]